MPESGEGCSGGGGVAPPVLKIVPVDGGTVINGGDQTKLKDMLAEINVSHELSRLAEMGKAPNFVKASFKTCS